MHIDEDSSFKGAGYRQIINAHFDTTNIIPIDETKQRILDTLETCASALFDHCGPNSGYAMLVEDKGIDLSFSPNQFTRDGIRILSAIEYVSPFERYFKDILTYVGTRVDDAAKDGTTTAMLLSALFLIELLNDRDNLRACALTMYQTNLVMKALFDKILRELEDYTGDLKKYTDNEEDERRMMECAGEIAYCQAMSSSGGNIDLAKAMREIFRQSPPSTWEFMDYYTSKKETGDAFTVEIDDFDAKIRCITGSAYALNYAFGTEYLEEDVTCVVHTEALMQHDFFANAIMDYVESIPADTPVSILAPMVDGMFTMRIEELNKSRAKPILIWQFSPEEQIAGVNYPWELMILMAKAGVSPCHLLNSHSFDPKASVFTAKIHWKDTYMHFYGSTSFDFEYDTDSVLHPMYQKPEHATKFYTQCIDTLNGLIEEYKEGHRPDGRLYSHFMRMLNSLICVRRPKLRLGGPVHEQIANMDVVQDVQGAIMSTLQHGFLTNGVVSLMFAVYETLSQLHVEDGEYTAPQAYAIYLTSALMKAITRLVTHLYPDHGLDAEENVELFSALHRGSAWDYLNALMGDHEIYKLYDYISEIDSTDVDEQDNQLINYPPIQPVMIYKELFKRMQELLLKVICTDKAVVYGGVMVKEDSDGDHTA